MSKDSNKTNDNCEVQVMFETGIFLHKSAEAARLSHVEDFKLSEGSNQTCSLSVLSWCSKLPMVFSLLLICPLYFDSIASTNDSLLNSVLS